MEANAAYYCLHRLHWPPRRFLQMSSREKAFVVAAIMLRLEQEKKARAQAKRSSARQR